MCMLFAGILWRLAVIVFAAHAVILLAGLIPACGAGIPFTGKTAGFCRRARKAALIALRGDDGCAFALSDDLLAYGFDGDWLMITYIADPDRLQRRVGYVHRDTFRRELNHPECANTAVSYLQHDPVLPLAFTSEPMTVAEDTVLTDDPTSTLNPLASLKRGEAVTVLATFMQEKDIRGAMTDWAYVEYVGEQPMRGFVPIQALR